MEDENLRDSLFFRQLTKLHRKTCLKAAQSGYFIAIPQTCSLTSSVVSRRDVDNHVLQPQTARGEFLTLSGRKVIMSGTEARTDAGFKQKVVAKILSAQTIPLEVPDGKGGTSPGKLHVYHISRPLEGGIDSPSSLDELTPAALSQYLGLLRGLPETEEGFYTVSAAVADVKKVLAGKDSNVAGKVALAQSKLRQAIDSAAQDLLGCSMFDGDAEAPDRMDTASRQVYVALESWACEQLHALLLPCLRTVKGADIDKLASALDSHAGEGMDKLEIPAKFRCDYGPVVDRLCSLHKCPTPLAKLHVLRDVTVDIVKCVEAALEAKGTDLSDVDLGADDVLSILTWVLLQAHARGPVGPGCPSAAADLPAHLAFIQRFRQPGCGPLDKSHLGYVFANIGQALGFFGADAGPDEVW